MNDELQKALAEIVKALTDAASKVSGVAQEQLPLLVREYLMWGLVSHLFWVVVGAAIVCAGYVIARRGRAAWIADEKVNGGAWHYDPFGFAMWTAAGWVVVGAGSLIAVLNAYTALQVLVAPRVYLLQEIAGLVK